MTEHKFCNILLNALRIPNNLHNSVVTKLTNVMISFNNLEKNQGIRLVINIINCENFKGVKMKYNFNISKHFILRNDTSKHSNIYKQVWKNELLYIQVYAESDQSLYCIISPYTVVNEKCSENMTKVKFVA